MIEAERLSTLPLLADLDDGERAEVAACAREVTIPAGATVAEQGDNAYQFFVIESGDADIRRDGDVIAFVGPGDVVGEIGMLVTGTRTASIVATSPMTLAAIFTREFKLIEKRAPAVAERLRAIVRERVAGTGYQSRQA